MTPVQITCPCDMPWNQSTNKMELIKNESGLLEPVYTQEFPLDLSCSDKKKRRSLLSCGICGKTFDRPSLLKRHGRTHTGEKPHACDVCDKAFSTKSSLNTHKRIHSGEKPHICQLCGKKFTASSNLYYHRMTHIKEKPHKCPVCPKSFPTPGDLRAHNYIHNGSWPYKCDVCDRGFSKVTNLRNHMFLHSGNRLHSCKHCGKKFTLAYYLRVHVRLHHNSDQDVLQPENIQNLKLNTIPEHEKSISATIPSIYAIPVWLNSSSGVKTLQWNQHIEDSTPVLFFEHSHEELYASRKVGILGSSFCGDMTMTSLLELQSLLLTQAITLPHLETFTCWPSTEETNPNRLNSHFLQ